MATEINTRSSAIAETARVTTRSIAIDRLILL